MKKAIMTIFFAVALFFNMPTEPVYPGMPTDLDAEATNLSSKIGSTMFAYYQFNYHDQLVVITTLRYCGAEDIARKVIDSVPDLPSFYLKQSSQQLLYDIIYKEAMISGYNLNSAEDFEKVSKQSLITGQSYFSGYLKGYQIAMQNYFDNKVIEPFCQAAISKADKYIQKVSSASHGK